MAEEGETARRLRLALVAIAALSVVGTLLELASLHHWESPVQLVAWVALLAVAVAIVLLAVGPGARAVQAARVLAIVVCLAAVLGMVEHVLGNYDAAPLDAEYGLTWDSMSEPARWWAAITKAVGPSPTLAPAVLIQASLCVLAATIRHPALRPSRRADGQGTP